MNKVLIFCFFILMTMPLIVGAVGILDKLRSDNVISAPPITKLSGQTETGSVEYALLQILKWFYAVFWILAVGFVIWAAFTFLFADGDEGKIGEAKNRLKYAVIAAIVGILAFGIDVIVKNLLTGN